jgi:hypothetical protein
MGAPKPCLGYPSRTAAIAALRSNGHDTGAIAQMIGIKTSDVAALECSRERHSKRPRRADRTPRTKLQQPIIEEICEMRERGLSYGQICNKLAVKGIEVSHGAVGWWCLRYGADSPKSINRKPPAPRAYMRNGKLVRSFTPVEDQELLRLDALGIGPTEMGKKMGRTHNSIIMRLATLARHEARQEGWNQ